METRSIFFQKQIFYTNLIFFLFSNEILKNQLPLGNISLTDAVLSQNGNKINVQLSEEKHELEASSEEDANTWLIAIKKGSEHTDESGGSSGELNIQQQRSLAQMKEEFPNTPDGDLIRFLKAKAWNADLASTLYKADQVWRQDVGIDRLKITSVYPHLITGKISTTGGVDKMGRIVLLTKARVHDPSSDFMETYLPSIYLIEKVLEGKDPNQQLILINDLTGFEKKHIDFRMYKLVLEMILAHYPERVGAIYCVSAPWTFTMIFKIIKPWLGSELISRVHIFSGYLELKQFIDDDQLLTEFGGKKVFDMKQWAAERAAIEGVSLQDVNTEKATHQFGNEEIVASFSDAPVSHTQEGSTKYGWMKKQGGFVKKFNKRYCVLKGSILYYYRGQNDQKAEGVVPLRKATLAYDNSQTFRIITMAGKDCIFQLTDKKRDWIETLEISILQNDGQIGTLHDSSSDPYDSIGMEGSQPLPALAKQTESIDDLVNAVYQLYADKINGKNDAQTAQGPLSGSELLQYLSDKLGLASNDSKALATRLLKYCFLQSTTGPSTSFSDSSSASYILGIHSKTTVLNAIRLSNSQAADPLPLVKQLHEQLVQLIQQFTVNGKVDLDPLRSSKQYFQFLLATTELQRVNLQANTPPVFFYNVRNILLLHAQLALGPSKTTFNRYQIFNEFQYVIGGSRYSVSDIGNGILRGNIPPVESTLPSHFDKRDTRVKFAVKKVEPKSIFSLFLGITIDPFHVCFISFFFSTKYTILFLLLSFLLFFLVLSTIIPRKSI